MQIVIKYSTNQNGLRQLCGERDSGMRCAQITYSQTTSPTTQIDIPAPLAFAKSAPYREVADERAEAAPASRRSVMDIDDMIRERRLRGGSGLGLVALYLVIVGVMVLAGMAIT